VVWRERARAAALVSESASAVHRKLFGADETLSFTLTTPQIGQLAGDADENELRAKLIDQLDRAAQREILQKRALIGPHRDDITVTLGDRSAKSFASQGQVRSVVLSLKLAVLELMEAQRNEVPVVLLDDVD